MATKRNSLRSKRIARSVPRQRGMPAAEREYQQVVREIEGSPLPDMNWSTQSPPTPVQRVRQTRYNQARPAPVPVIRKGLQALERAVPQVREAEAFVGGGIKIIGSRLAQSSLKAATAQRGQIASDTKKAIIDVWDGSSTGVRQNYGSNKAIKSSIQDTQRQLDKLKNQTWDTVDQSLYGAKADFVTSQATRVTRLTKTLELQKGLLTSARSPPPPQAWNPIVTTGTSTAKQADDFIPSAYKPDIKMGDKILAQSPTGTQVIGTSKKVVTAGKITSPHTPGKTGRWAGFGSSFFKKNKVKFGVVGGMSGVGLYGGTAVGSAFTPEVTTPTSPVNEDAYGAWLSDAGVQRNVPKTSPSVGTWSSPFGGYGTKEAQQQALAMEQARVIDMLAKENKSLQGIKTPGLVAIPGGGGKMGYAMKIGERADGTDIIQYLSGGGKHGAQKMADAKRIQKERQAMNKAQKERQIRAMSDPMYAYGLAMSGQAQITEAPKQDKRMIIKFKGGKTGDMPFNQAAFDFYKSRGIPVSAKNVRAPQSGVAGGGYRPGTVEGVPIQTRLPADWKSFVPTGSAFASWTPQQLREYYGGGSQR